MRLGRRGFSLIELTIVVALMGIVIVLAYTFYFFGDKTFRAGVAQSNVQANVRLAADRIVQQVRYASEVVIQDDCPSPVPEGKSSICSNNVLSQIPDGLTFTLSFDKGDNNKILRYTISGTDGKKSYAITSEIILLNSVVTITGTHSEKKALVYIEGP